MSSKKLPKAILVKDERLSFRPHKLGRRSIEDLAREMHLYVMHLKKKGLRVVRLS